MGTFKRKRDQKHSHARSHQLDRVAVDGQITNPPFSERVHDSVHTAVKRFVPMSRIDSYVPESSDGGKYRIEVSQPEESVVEVIRHGWMKFPVELQSLILDNFACRAHCDSNRDDYDTVLSMTLVNKALRPVALQHLHRHTTANFDRKDSPLCARYLADVINTSCVSMHLDIVISTPRGQGHFQEWIQTVDRCRELTISFLDKAHVGPQDNSWPPFVECRCERGRCRCVNTKSCNLSSASFDAFSGWFVKKFEVTSVDLPAWPMEERWSDGSADIVAGMDGHITLNTAGKRFQVGFVKDTPIDWIGLLIYFRWDPSSTLELELSQEQETYEDWENLLISIQSRMFTRRIQMNVASLTLQGKYLGFFTKTKMLSVLDRETLRSLTLQNCSETSNLLSQLHGALPSLHSFTLYEQPIVPAEAADFSSETVEKFLQHAPSIRELTLQHQRSWTAKSEHEAATSRDLSNWAVKWRRIGGSKLQKLHIFRGAEPMTLAELLDIQTHCPLVQDFGCRLFGPRAKWHLFPEEGWCDEQTDEDGVKQYPFDLIFRSIAAWPDLQRVSFGYEKIKLAWFKDHASKTVDPSSIVDDGDDPSTRYKLYRLAELLHDSRKTKRAEFSL